MLNNGGKQCGRSINGETSKEIECWKRITMWEGSNWRYKKGNNVSKIEKGCGREIIGYTVRRQNATGGKRMYNGNN